MVQIPRIHPGEMLREEFMMPLSLSADALATRTGLTVEHIEGIVAEREGITPDVAERLGAAFGQSPEFWMNIRSAFDRGGR